MQPVIITTLGEFSIAYGEKILSEKDKRSKKMWTLLKYLTAFIDKGVSQSELIKILWENEDIGNPAGALKTQLHRLRTTLDILELPEEAELVTSYSGTYAFSSSLEYEVDAVAFEKNFKQSQRTDISEKEQISYVKKAFDMYKGDFMKNSAEDKWLVPIRLYYHSIYVRITHRLIDALHTHKQYAELINICRQALQIERADQKIHMLLIKALIAVNDRDAAKKHYKYVMDMLYNELGANPLPELKELYREIIDKDSGVEDDLEAIQKKLKEDISETESGAYFCELEVFKNIYRLKMRDAARSKQKVQICLITVSAPESSEVESKKIITEMKRLHGCVSGALRKSDVFARYGLSQYILMLPVAKEEDSEIVVSRISKAYKKNSTGFMLDVNFKYAMAT
jgi:DNA-binding SARP family transcriptional activator